MNQNSNVTYILYGNMSLCIFLAFRLHYMDKVIKTFLCSSNASLQTFFLFALLFLPRISLLIQLLIRACMIFYFFLNIF
jgi:hypothetical protein